MKCSIIILLLCIGLLGSCRCDDITETNEENKGKEPEGTSQEFENSGTDKLEIDNSGKDKNSGNNYPVKGNSGTGNQENSMKQPEQMYSDERNLHNDKHKKGKNSVLNSSALKKVNIITSEKDISSKDSSPEIDAKHSQSTLNESDNQTKWIERFTETLKLLKKLDLHNRLQDILVHYVVHFNTYDKMTMKTRFGVKTIPISDKIQRNLTIMAHWSLHIEYTRGKLINDNFNLTEPVNMFKFIYNNTILLDKAIEHVNGSFNFHDEVENPQRLRFYPILKRDPRFFQMDDLNRSMDVLIVQQRDRKLTASDILTGSLRGTQTSDLNADDCIALGEHAHKDNLSHTVLFYEAALRKFDTLGSVVANKTQHIENMIKLYTDFGDVCNHRVTTLKSQLEDWLANNQSNPRSDDEEEEMTEKSHITPGEQYRRSNKSNKSPVVMVVAENHAEKQHKLSSEDSTENLNVADNLENIDELDILCVNHILNISKQQEFHAHDEL